MLNHIEEKISAALDKLKLSQEQFLHNQVIYVIKKQSEILSDHKKLLDSVCLFVTKLTAFRDLVVHLKLLKNPIIRS